MIVKCPSCGKKNEIKDKNPARCVCGVEKVILDILMDMSKGVGFSGNPGFIEKLAPIFYFHQPQFGAYVLIVYNKDSI